MIDVRYQVARYLVGTLLLFVAVSLFVPLAYALWWGEPAVPAFTVMVGLCLGVGWLLRHRAAALPQEVTTREGSFAVVAVWREEGTAGHPLQMWHHLLGQ